MIPDGGRATWEQMAARARRWIKLPAGTQQVLHPRHGVGQSPRWRSTVYLAGRAVGHARPLVAGQVEVGGAGALVASARREETEVTAAAVVCLAWVVEH